MKLPAALPLRDGALVAWRLDEARFAESWDSGEGAYRFGGRWNSKGVRAVYCATDPGTAILEVAVHKGFETLDSLRHVLTAAMIDDLDAVRVVTSADVPNTNWLRPGTPGAGQQAFGNALLVKHKFVLFPSVVSPHSWNVVFIAEKASGSYRLSSQEPLALDSRLNPPA